MKKIEVTEEEWTILRDHKNHGPTLRMRLKAEAIMLLSRGVAHEVVAEMVDREPSPLSPVAGGDDVASGSVTMVPG